MTCYRNGGCGPFEMYSCNVCPASKPEYLQREQPKPKTRADRIRAMSDEQLAAYIGHASLCVTIQGEDGGAWCSQYGSCNECIREWLRQEVEE